MKPTYQSESGMVKKSKLADRLSALMRHKAISARALSKATGVPQSTLSHLLSGRSSQKPEHLLAISQFFGISMESLIFGEDAAQVSSLESVLTEEVFSGWIKVKIERAVPNKRKQV